jgi:DNA-binding MarR family transcriptional regulator
VTASLLSAMWSIERLQPVTLGELSTAERVQPPTITRIANSLESAGLVRRETDPMDRRVCRVRLTSKGQRLLDRTRSQRTAYLHRRLRALAPADRQVLEQAAPLLERLLEDG